MPRPRLNWRQFHNPWSQRKGLFRLSDAAKQRVEQDQRNYLMNAQASSVARKFARMNDHHLASGFPPIELTGARTPSVNLDGKMLADFPFIAREWDPANEGDPATTSAGSSTEVGWVCAMHQPPHRWRTKVSNRTRRLTGCTTQRGRAAEKDMEDASDLASIRAAWGDYEAPPAPVAENAPEGEWFDEEDPIGFAVELDWDGDPDAEAVE